MRRYLRALGASRDEADDLTQETLLAAMALLTAPQRQIRDETAFVLGIARHQWLRSRRWWHRRRERQIADAVDDLWQRTTAHDGGDARLAALRACLDELQPRARQALELHYRDGLAWRDVAAQVDLRPNGVKTLAQRARTALRSCIERRVP